jgi:hypothetical protein
VHTARALFQCLTSDIFSAWTHALHSEHIHWDESLKCCGSCTAVGRASRAKSLARRRSAMRGHCLEDSTRVRGSSVSRRLALNPCLGCVLSLLTLDLGAASLKAEDIRLLRAPEGECLSDTALPGSGSLTGKLDQRAWRRSIHQARA